MKLTIDPKIFAEAVAWTAHALPRRPAAPVLAGILLETDQSGPEDTIRLSAFDYDTSRRTYAPAEVAEPGKVLLPGRILAEVAKALPAGRPVELALSGAEVTLTAGATEFTLVTMPAEDYPSLPTLPEQVGAVDGEQFAAAVAQVARAASRDEAVPMLTGIRVDITSGGVTMAATDRYRIAAQHIGWEPTLDDAELGVVVPAVALTDMVKGLAGRAALHLDEKLVAVTAGGRTSTARLLGHEYIDYESRLGDEGYTSWVAVDVAALTAAVKRVMLVAERSTGVRLSVRDGEILVQAGGGEVGRGSESVPASLDGPPVEIAFQQGYFLDGLAGVSGRQARIGMTKDGKPALVLDADEASTYRYLVMALRVAS